MSIQSAIKCFDENIELFGGPQTDPEKYNLYRGLGEMADAIKNLGENIDAIKKVVDHIQRQARQ